MAFKRYAALLAGSALAGSALFAQPAMAEEAATEPAEFSYAPVTVEKGQTAESAAPAGADDCARILPVSTSAENLKLVEELGADVDKESGVVSFDQTELDTAPEANAYTLNIACAIEKEGETTEWKTTPLEVTVEEKVLTFNAITAEQGAAVTLTQATAPTEFTDLATDTAGFTLSEADGKVTLKIDEDATIGEHTVKFTYKAYGEDKNGTFEVTVEKADEPGAPVVTIGDVTVTQGETETVTANVEEGATDLTLNAPEGIKATLGENNVITIDATDAEAKTYTVEFTYQADGETKNGTFEVTVEKKKDENASSKASSNFRGSFKALSSK